MNTWIRLFPTVMREHTTGEKAVVFGPTEEFVILGDVLCDTTPDGSLRRIAKMRLTDDAGLPGGGCWSIAGLIYNQVEIRSSDENPWPNSKLVSARGDLV